MTKLKIKVGTKWPKRYEMTWVRNDLGTKWPVTNLNMHLSMFSPRGKGGGDHTLRIRQPKQCLLAGRRNDGLCVICQIFGRPAHHFQALRCHLFSISAIARCNMKYQILKYFNISGSLGRNGRLSGVGV